MFDISKLGIGEWFPYQDSKVNHITGEIEWLPIDPESDEKICFRQPDMDIARARMEKNRGKKINNPVYNPNSRAMEIVVTYEQTPEQAKADNMSFWDDAITDWTIKDPRTKKVIPLTAENKYLLIKGDMAFLRFCNRSLQLLSGITVEGEKVKEKNL